MTRARDVPAAFCAAILALASAALAAPAKLSPLAPKPDWSRLDAFQETITRDEFTSLLDRVYAPGGAWKETIQIDDSSATVATSEGSWQLRFAASAESAKAVPGFWRSLKSLPAPASADKPLAGVHIAIDPGHLGGPWAKMEERWFRVGGGKPVQEGDMTLLVAKKLKARLEAMGARVSLTRTKASPATSLRPEKLRKQAAASLADKGKPATAAAIRKESELLFYRTAEIRARARAINSSIQPDAVVCLHFNAEDWGSESRPRLLADEHLHFLVTGAWSASELAYEDHRFDMLSKLLGRTFLEELALTNKISKPMAAASRLPPYTYTSGNAIRVDDNPYVWARNLLANRLFQCPVVYVEPYLMNGKLTYARIQAGDYDGTRNFAGVPRKSIYREYADSVAEGIAAHFAR